MSKLPPTILFVDDNADDRLLVRQAFKKVGVTDTLQVLEGEAEAIEYLMGEGQYADRTKFRYPDFIITDLKMPQMDGFAVLDSQKQNSEWAVIPTVVLSGSADPDDIATAFLLGASQGSTEGLAR